MRFPSGSLCVAALSGCAFTAAGSSLYSNQVFRNPPLGDQSISGTNGVIFDDVLVPAQLNPTNAPIPITSVTVGILRDPGAPGFTLTGYGSTTFIPRVFDFPQMNNSPTVFGSVAVPAFTENQSTIQFFTIPAAPGYALAPQTTDVPGYHEFALGLRFSSTDFRNSWCVAVPNSPSPNEDGAWDYNIPGNQNAAYALSQGAIPIWTTFMMSVNSSLPAQWKTNGDGTWGVTGNWWGGVPNAAGDGANFGPIITAPRTVTLAAPVTVGLINFDNANRYTIAGAPAITFDTAAGNATINVVSGSHTIATAVQLNKTVSINVPTVTSVMTLSGDMSSAPSAALTKTGAGKLEVRHVRADALNLGAGQVKVLPNGGDTGTSNVKSLLIAGSTNSWVGTLDLTDNDAVIDYSGSSPIAIVGNQLKTGYNNGAWNGTGIASSAAAASPPSQKTAIGFAEATDLFASFPALFSGQTIDADSVLMRYTLAGDANLDLTVNSGDFNLLATNFGQSGVRWSQGDFTFDGTANSADFNVLASNFGQTLASGAGVSVPEPSAMILTAAGALLASRRRTRAVIRHR